MVLAFKEGRVPEQWRYVEFGKILLLQERMKIKPIGAEEQSPMYNIVSNEDQRFDSARAVQDRSFVDWKKILTYFILLASPIPNDEELALYEKELLKFSNDRQEINLSDFIKVSYLF
jgi:hypothetical protein